MMMLTGFPLERDLLTGFFGARFFVRSIASHREHGGRYPAGEVWPASPSKRRPSFVLCKYVVVSVSEGTVRDRTSVG